MALPKLPKIPASHRLSDLEAKLFDAIQKIYAEHDRELAKLQATGKFMLVKDGKGKYRRIIE